MGKNILIASLFIFCTCYTSAQSVKTILSGSVVDKQEAPVENATLLLLNSTDSSYLAGTITDLSGIFTLENIRPGMYLLEVSMLGYKKVYQPVELLTNKSMELPSIQLEEDPYQLSDVVVTADQKHVRLEAGKTTVDLSSAIVGTGGHVFEVMKGLPGVIVREDGTVILNGQAGVTVLVDNKPTYLSGESLISLLRSMPSSSVNKIELITHPPAKYDAAGNSGLINIQTKKIKMKGVSVSPVIGYQQGAYGRGNTGLNFSFRKNKLNLFADYSYNQGKNYNDLTTYREYIDPDTKEPLSNFMNQDSYRKYGYKSHYYKVGIDYDLSEKTTVGIYTNGSVSNRTIDASMDSRFSSNQLLTVDSTLYTINNNKTGHKNFAGGVNFAYISIENGEWITSFDYLLFKQTEEQSQHNRFENRQNEIFKRDTLQGAIDGNISMYSGQTGFVYPLSNQCKLSAGAKATFISIDNSALYSNRLNDNWVVNTSLSNIFGYKENINAVYLQLNMSFSEFFRLEAGLRMENTNIQGKLADTPSTKDSTFKHYYTHLFPSFLIQYKLPHGNSLSFLYRRRIIRPNYRDLNPFIYMFDQYTYEQGNTALDPEITDNIEISFILKNKYSINTFFSYTKDPISKGFIVGENDRILVFPMNLSSNITWGLRLGSGSLNPYPWWQINTNISMLSKWFKWSINGKEESNHRVTSSINLNNQFRLPKGWGAEITGYYNGKLAEGQSVIYPMWMLSAGIRKNILDNNGTVRLVVNDIFSSFRFKTDIFSPAQFGRTSETEDNQYIGISCTYRFNSGAGIKDSRRKTGIEESKRLNLSNK